METERGREGAERVDESHRNRQIRKDRERVKVIR